MGYLMCDKCAGYYELHEGENPEDYDLCQCGGSLRYVDEIPKVSFKNRLILSINIKRLAGVLVGGVIMFLSFYILSPDPYSTNFVYNSNLAFFFWFAGGMVSSLIAGGNIKSGASNGFYSACISGMVVIFYNFYVVNNYFNSTSTADNLAFLAALCAVYILVPALFSVFGGILAVISRKIVMN